MSNKNQRRIWLGSQVESRVFFVFMQGMNIPQNIFQKQWILAWNTGCKFLWNAVRLVTLWLGGICRTDNISHLISTIQCLHREVLCCVYLSWRRWGERSGGGGFSSAVEDQERRLLHAGSEEAQDTQRRGSSAPAHTPVLNQRTLLQPQGTIIRRRAVQAHPN